MAKGLSEPEFNPATGQLANWWVLLEKGPARFRGYREDLRQGIGQKYHH